MGDQRDRETAGRRGPRRWQVLALLLMLYDMAVADGSYLSALLLRFDLVWSRVPEQYMRTFLRVALPYALLCLAVSWALGLYRSIWRFASYTELLRLLAANASVALIQALGTTALLGTRMPLSYHVWGATFQTALTCVPRFGYRFLLLERDRGRKDGDPVMLIGAGSAGQMILRDIRSRPELRQRVVCIIDDDPDKWGRSLDGVPVVGGRDEILASVEKYAVRTICLAIPGASAAEKRDILQICSESGCELRQLPGMYRAVQGDVRAGDMQAVSLEDLLGREPIRTDMAEVFRSLNGRTILVTGGGGSIGSELCRQIASHHPRRLIVFDIYENNAYALQMELHDRWPGLDVVVLIGSVRDSRKIEEVFRTYRPEIVYHAAAHKHVPLMEDSPCEAVKNNVFGTYKTAYAAMAFGCERFVLISTDKAVAPTNIMGASKRLCEMTVQSFAAKVAAGEADRIPRRASHPGDLPQGADLAGTRTRLVAVRFGNVLGSNGSVVPIFQRQIASGGPVTVTHPDIKRYFMTIPEAAGLVLLAGTYAEGGEIFVLDMGSEVRIDALARNLIRMSGYRPDIDIRIEYTGLRRGEKLYEEKLMAEEGLRRTANGLIHIGRPIPFDTDAFLGSLGDLMDAACRNDEEGTLEMVRELVPTYHPEDGGPMATGGSGT